MPLRSVPLTLLILLGGACATPPEDIEEAAPRTAELRDFSGHWEKDYQRSDDFNTLYRLYVADLRGRLQRQGGNDLGPGQFSSRAIRADAESVNGLARFTEELTRLPMLVIEQSEDHIEIDREEDFTLSCQYEDRQFVSRQTPFGSEVCGWDGERLIIRMNLGSGLDISHRFSLSPDGSMLNVTTRVSSAQASLPITVSNYYQRFDPPESDYDCTLTLTRSQVCRENLSR